MGPEGAVNIVYARNRPPPEAEPEAMRREKIEEFRERFANPYVAAERGYIDAVIEPRETRAQADPALRMLENKRGHHAAQKARQHSAVKDFHS